MSRGSLDGSRTRRENLATNRAALVAFALVVCGCARDAARPAVERPTATAVEPDPVSTDGDKYHVVLEDERVRVLRYHDEPGQKTHRHRHPAFVLYALAPFRRRLTFPDGTRKEIALGAGDVVSMTAQTHVGENVGTTDTDVVIIELKTSSDDE